MLLFEARNTTCAQSWYNMSDTDILADSGNVRVALKKVRKAPTLQRFGGTADKPAIPYLHVRVSKKRDRIHTVREIDLGEKYDECALVLWHITAGEGGKIAFDTEQALKVVLLRCERGPVGLHAYLIALMKPGTEVSVQRSGMGITKTALRLRYEKARVMITGESDNAFPEPGVVPVRISFSPGNYSLYRGCDEAGPSRMHVLRSNALRLAQHLDPDSAVLFVGIAPPRVVLAVHEVFRPFCRTIYCSGSQGPDLIFDKNAPS